MFIDASAIVAILHREPEKEALEEALDAAKTPFYVSALSLYEATIGLARAKLAVDGKIARKPTAREIEQADAAVGLFVSDLGAEKIAISAEIGRIALEASKRFGKTVGHPADLNFGDCFAYACARACRVPLLFKGKDFSQTDINVA